MCSLRHLGTVFCTQGGDVMGERKIGFREWLALGVLAVVVVMSSLAPEPSFSCERYGADAQCFEVASS
jgi:hypothetical protein